VRWLPSDDVYMVASVGLYLLTGVEPNNGRVDLRGIDDPDLVAALWLSRQERHLRPRDAAEMLGILSGEWAARPRPPASLRGVPVVLVGVPEFVRPVRRAGAIVQEQVDAMTRLVVRNGQPSTKLIAARAAQLRGQQLSIVSDRWLARQLSV
jgi:hypothetical protein